MLHVFVRRSVGPPTAGYLSDYFTDRAALAAGVSFDGLDEKTDRVALQKFREPYRDDGIRSAMYVLPLVSLLFAGTLFGAAAR